MRTKIFFLSLAVALVFSASARSNESIYDTNSWYDEFEQDDIDPSEQYIEIEGHVLDDQDFYAEPEEEYQETDIEENNEDTEDID